MALDASQMPPGSQPCKRRPKVGPDALFALLVALVERPDASLGDLAASLTWSSSTVKRLVRVLRASGIVRGRVGNLQLNLALLGTSPHGFCTALVAVEPDIARLKVLSQERKSPLSEYEENLLHCVCADLAKDPAYAGRVLVERGYIVMGAPNFCWLITVYAESTAALFDFVRQGVERTDGIARTQTMMVTRAEIRS